MARAAGDRPGLADAHLINTAVAIHHDDPEFGYRFIADELERHGIIAGRKRVNRLCTMQRLWSVHLRKRSCRAARARRCTTTSSGGASPPGNPTGSG